MKLLIKHKPAKGGICATREYFICSLKTKEGTKKLAYIINREDPRRNPNAQWEIKLEKLARQYAVHLKSQNLPTETSFPNYEAAEAMVKDMAKWLKANYKKPEKTIAISL